MTGGFASLLNEAKPQNPVIGRVATLLRWPLKGEVLRHTSGLSNLLHGSQWFTVCEPNTNDNFFDLHDLIPQTDFLRSLPIPGMGSLGWRRRIPRFSSAGD
jgi:hypothetical protein